MGFYSNDNLRFCIRQPDTNLYAASHEYGASALCAEPVYLLALAVTHCTYPQRDGQAELPWVAGYILRQFTHTGLM